MVPARHPLAPAKHSWQATTGKIRPTKTHKHLSSSKGSSNAAWHTQQSPSNEQERPDAILGSNRLFLVVRGSYTYFSRFLDSKPHVTFIHVCVNQSFNTPRQAVSASQPLRLFSPPINPSTRPRAETRALQNEVDQGITSNKEDPTRHLWDTQSRVGSAGLNTEASKPEVRGAHGRAGQAQHAWVI